MPNGGVHHCGNCLHFVADESRCALRGVPIAISHWTTCRNFNRSGSDAVGPIYAIVCEVRNRAGSYVDIPYFEGCRVDTVQPDETGNTVVRFVDSAGAKHEFATVSEYVAFYRESGREL